MIRIQGYEVGENNENSAANKLVDEIIITPNNHHIWETSWRNKSQPVF